MKIGFALSFFQSCLLIRHGFAAPPSPLGKAFVEVSSFHRRGFRSLYGLERRTVEDAGPYVVGWVPSVGRGLAPPAPLRQHLLRKIAASHQKFPL